MKYMLDTNICSYIIKNKPLEVYEKFKSIPMTDCLVSSITVAELQYWVARNYKLHEQSNNQGQPKINEMVIDNFLSHLVVKKFDDLAADYYGKIRADLEARGVGVGNMDLMIGAHAISLSAILVTNNIKEFETMPDIQLENWVTEVNSD